MTVVRRPPPPSIRAFPRHDRCFAQAVEHAAALLVPIGAGALAVEAVLRTVYPDARIRVRHGLAAMRGEQPVWYAFRDGRVSVTDGADGAARGTAGPATVPTAADVPTDARVRRPCEATDTRAARRRPVAVAAQGA